MNDFLMTLPEDVALSLTDRVNGMMVAGGKYDPFTADNLQEALAEAKDEQYAQLAAHLRSGDMVAVNAALHLIAREYWFNYACRAEVHNVEEEIAQEEFDGPDLPWKLQEWERDLPSFLRPQVAW